MTVLRALVVECSDLKQCLCFSRYSIKSFSRSSPVSFVIGERRAIGLKLLDSSIGFPGLCRGITRPTFQMFGILAL